MSKRLTWDDLATACRKATGRNARTRPMGEVFAWAEGRPDLFRLDADGYLYHVAQA